MRSSSPNRRSALGRALQLKPRDWLDLAVATVELGIARLSLAQAPHTDLLRVVPGSEAVERGTAERRAERVRLAIARSSHRLPWRSDCLVQAIAARRWLARLGVPTELAIGVPEAQQEGFEAHAWLTHQGRVITGGDISQHVPLRAAADSVAAE